MSAKNDGGPAFPRPPFSPGTLHDNAADAGFAATGRPGMSLRDWFAGQALIGFMSQCEHSLDPKIAIVDVFAMWCYTYADAMLKAREKGPQ